ncbi:fumarylacetoacetate hydrolase family protein [Streptomyces canus]|uniref:fumarylacetoacetate hydrolase family protein n=1 Tax=Streptomyces canus TaxID=58343 RepID=UPI0007486FC3|nr:fumarylacetoacetate hydrolase family protein [Streptomyces canus]KUN04275.1 fumarylacetoacetate hydrolase [Streptomyces canus]
MRVINHGGRVGLERAGRWLDVEIASDGWFTSDPMAVYARWNELHKLAEEWDFSEAEPIDRTQVLAPVPHPQQIFAVGLNYREHAKESGLDIPQAPFIFTKFPASVTGPYSTVELPTKTVDFELELVAVIGDRAHRVEVADAWGHVAGLTVGQDLSERELQLSGPAPQQFGLGKSYAGFSPIGPVVVSVDEFDDPDDIALRGFLSGQEMQRTRTSDLIFAVPQLVSYLSHVLPLLPGDLIFTGTPSGVGWGRRPQRYIQPTDELVSRAEGIGEMHHRFVSVPARVPSDAGVRE